jgi:hypothetical protein
MELMIIPFLALGFICMIDIRIIIRQKDEIKRAEAAYKELAAKYRRLKNA